jgi:hypothetical protein
MKTQTTYKGEKMIERNGNITHVYRSDDVQFLIVNINVDDEEEKMKLFREFNNFVEHLENHSKREVYRELLASNHLIVQYRELEDWEIEEIDDFENGFRYWD